VRAQNDAFVRRPHLLATFGSVVVEDAPLRSTWIVGALSYLSLVPRGSCTVNVAFVTLGAATVVVTWQRSTECHGC